MRDLRFLIVLSFFIFFTGCIKTPQELMLDSFEGEISSNTVDFGSAEGTTVKVEAAKDIIACGKQSLKIDYDLKPSGYMWVSRGYGLDLKGAAKWEVEPQNVQWKKYKAIVLSMYGSNSGGVVAFDIRDDGGEYWRALLDDDFEGWKEITCGFNEFFPRGDWQPEKAVRNETLDFPIKSFQFEPRLPGKGVYYFDCVKVTKVKKKK